MSASKISELTPSEIGIITQVLSFDPEVPSFGSKRPGPYDIILDWLDEQYDHLTSKRVPSTIARPLGLRASAIIPSIMLRLPDRWLPPKAILCESHKPLNPWLIRRIYMQIVGECGVRNEELVVLADKLEKEQKKEREQARKEKGKGRAVPEQEDQRRDADGHRKITMSKDIRDWLNRMLWVNSLWMSRCEFRRVYPGIPGDILARIPLPHEASNCQACILSYIGGNSQILFDLEVSMRGRKKRGHDLRMKLLWPLLEGWKAGLAENEERHIQAVALGQKVKRLRRRLQKKRHRMGKMKVPSPEATTRRDSAGPSSPQFDHVGKRDAERRAEQYLEATPVDRNGPEAKAEKANYKADLGYEAYLENHFGDGVDDEAEFGEGQTESDERRYEESVLSYYNRLGSTHSIAPAPGDAYGTGEYVRPEPFAPFKTPLKTPSVKVRPELFRPPTEGSAGWEDEDVQSFYNVQATTSVAEDVANPPYSRRLDSQNIRSTAQPAIHWSKDLTNPFFTRQSNRDGGTNKRPSYKTRYDHSGRGTATSNYSKESVAYRHYEPFDLRTVMRGNAERENEDTGIIPDERTAAYRNLVGTLDSDDLRHDENPFLYDENPFLDNENPFLDDGFPVEERKQKALSAIQSDSESVYQTAASSDEVADSSSLRPTTRLESAAPQRSSPGGSPLIPHKPLNKRSIRSCYGGNGDIGKLRVATVDVNGKSRVPPHPTVESCSDSDSSITRWSDLFGKPSAFPPEIPSPPSPEEQKSKTKKATFANRVWRQRKIKTDKNKIGKPLAGKTTWWEVPPADQIYTSKPLPSSPPYLSKPLPSTPPPSPSTSDLLAGTSGDVEALNPFDAPPEQQPETPPHRLLGFRQREDGYF